MAKAVDIGTSFVVGAQLKDGKEVFTIERDAFFSMEREDFAEEMLDDAGAKYLLRGKEIFVVGEDALKYCMITGKQDNYRRPMARGVLNPGEEEAIPLIEMLIEAIVGKDYYIDQLAVVGDQRSAIGAIVVPAFEALLEFARERKLPFRDHDELISLPEVVELYRQRIRAQSLELAPFEKIRRFTLVAKQFSRQAGEITPTLKIRRKVVAEKYHELIERMYGSPETPGNDTSA